MKSGMVPGADLGATYCAVVLTWHSGQMKRTGVFQGVSELTNLPVLVLPSLWILFCDIMHSLLIT